MADRSYTAVVAANGQATVTIQTLKNVRWIVSQISVEMANAPSGASCEIRKNGSFITPLVASGDAATGDPPIELWPTDSATVTWKGATPGLVGKVFALYDEEPYP
jgi:hypothetical protein